MAFAVEKTVEVSILGMEGRTEMPPMLKTRLAWISGGSCASSTKLTRGEDGFVFCSLVSGTSFTGTSFDSAGVIASLSCLWCFRCFLLYFFFLGFASGDLVPAELFSFSKSRWVTLGTRVFERRRPSGSPSVSASFPLRMAPS